MNEKDPRSQLVAKIKSASNVLVTVSRSPSVDQLAAALGLTFVLDKMGKHTTAVFSGEIPPAINFLEPEKTFEGTVDSLRDFVISLDKEKADRLRYKVEGDLVKIYITPYKTTISEKDLEFNEGDFNIELVVAIGVKNKEHLDEAITAHGGLLHDATVATMTSSDDNKNAFGAINWQNAEAGCLSEMVANLVEDLSDKDKPLLDEHIATTLLTGVVAATDQFRNDKTSANVMTLAANLMSKGANQQLIASELSATDDLPSTTSDADETDGATLPTNEPEPETLSIDRNFTPGEEDHLVTNTEAMAAEDGREALSKATSELAAVVSERDTSPEPTPPSPQAEEINPADLPPLPAPTVSSTPNAVSAPTPTPAPASTSLTPGPAVAGQNELDTLVASSPALSHATPYAESATGFPLNSAVAGSDEPASVNPLESIPPATTPMINATPTASFTPPAISLPPPPPLPTPNLGQLPPLPSNDPTIAANSLLDPESAPPVLNTPVPTQVIPRSGVPVSDPIFPNTSTNPADPAQFQIPGQQ
jgi:hypothetical protein